MTSQWRFTICQLQRQFAAGVQLRRWITPFEDRKWSICKICTDFMCECYAGQHRNRVIYPYFGMILIIILICLCMFIIYLFMLIYYSFCKYCMFWLFIIYYLMCKWRFLISRVVNKVNLRISWLFAHIHESSRADDGDAKHLWLKKNAKPRRAFTFFSPG